MRIVNGRGIKSPADLVGLKPFKDAKLLRHEAIERMKRRMERNLLDSVEELLLLHPELLEEGELDPLLLEDISRLGHRHERTSGLFSAFRERLGLPDPDAEADAANRRDGADHYASEVLFNLEEHVSGVLGKVRAGLDLLESPAKSDNSAAR